MIKFNYITKEKVKEHNPNWPQNPDHPYRILIIAIYGLEKTNSLFNLVSHQSDIDKSYLYPGNPYVAKYQLLINKQGGGLEKFNNSKTFIAYSNDWVDIYENILEYNPVKERNVLAAFDDMIADFLINKKPNNPIVAELFIRSRKLKMSLTFITQSSFTLTKNVRINSTHYFVMKIPNKREFEQILFSNSSDIAYEFFMNPCKKFTAKQFYLLVIDTTLVSDNSLRFRKNLLERI